MSQKPFKIVENTQKQMPCNIEAEQAVIGSILVSNDIYDEVSPIIDAQKFFEWRRPLLFLSYQKGLLSQPCHLVSLI